MTSFNLKAPENQPVKFVELFLDVIYVFSIVQIVELLHGHFDFISVLEAVLVFWLVWWSWVQFTWVLNSADTEHDIVELAILLVTAISFFMAISIPGAFGVEAFKFVIAYTASRVVGLVLYGFVARSYGESTLQAVLSFGLISATGIISAIAGALLGGTAQYILWSLVIILDVIAAVFPIRREGFYLQPEHFVERHGLFVIIVLGETLIINANGLVDAANDNDVLILAIMAVFVTLAFWWTYFAHNKHKLEEVMVELGPENDSFIGRDIYSLGHFPIIFGVIAYASAIEEVIAHPTDPVGFETKMAFVVGILLFVSGIAMVIKRATGELLRSRIVIPLVLGILIFAIPSITPVLILALIFVGIVIIGVLEERHHK